MLDLLSFIEGIIILKTRKPPAIGNEEQCRCKYCGKTFITLRLLMKHVEKVHLTIK